MKVEFNVANAMKNLVSTTASVDGEDQRVLVDGLEVELVAVKSSHGSLMLRFTGKEAAQAAEVFKKDGKVYFEVAGG